MRGRRELPANSSDDRRASLPPPTSWGSPLREEQSVDSVSHDFRLRPDIACDHQYAGAVRFESRVAATFLSQEREDRTPAALMSLPGLRLRSSPITSTFGTRRPARVSREVVDRHTLRGSSCSCSHAARGVPTPSQVRVGRQRSPTAVRCTPPVPAFQGNGVARTADHSAVRPRMKICLPKSVSGCRHRSSSATLPSAAGPPIAVAITRECGREPQLQLSPHRR